MNFQSLGEGPQADGAETGEELKDVTSGGETEFVEGEKKKPQITAETLGMVGVLAACGAVLFMMYLRNGPQSASGADLSANPAGSVVSDFLSHGEEHVKSMWQALHDTDKFVSKFRTYSKREQIPLAALRTNPFRQVEARVVSSSEPDTEGMTRHRRDVERAEVTRAAEGLQLQSVLRGPRNACLINNNLYQQGQQVEGFTIEEITANSVIVRSGTYRFELKIGR